MIDPIPLYAVEATALIVSPDHASEGETELLSVAIVGVRGGLLDLRRRGVWTFPPSGRSQTRGRQPNFAADWREFAAVVGATPVVGRDIDQALALLANLCDQADIARPPWLPLDLACLAEVVERGRGTTLDAMAQWLDLEPAENESPLAHAELAAEIFLALVPRLQGAGIHTLAGAHAACEMVRLAAPTQQSASPSAAPPERGPFRIDTHPYRRRVRDVMSAAKFVSSRTSLAEVLKMMVRDRISSVFLADIADDGLLPLPRDVGILTERDVLRAVSERGDVALQGRAGEFATSPLAAVPFDAFLYRAMGRMTRLKVRHLGVVGEDGRVSGAVTVRDLLTARVDEALWLGDDIEDAVDLPALARAWANLPLVADSLLREGMKGADVSAIIARELGAVTRRAFVFAEQRMRDAGRGDPPCAYAVALTGAGGRGEALLTTRSEFIVAYAEDRGSGADNRWFSALSEHAEAVLHQLGLSPGLDPAAPRPSMGADTMVRWRDRISGAITAEQGADTSLLEGMADARAVHGSPELIASLRRDTITLATGEVAFCAQLVRASQPRSRSLVPSSWFPTVRGGVVDLVESGLTPASAVARALALQFGVRQIGTLDRLLAIRDLSSQRTRELEAVSEGWAKLLDLLLRRQTADAGLGISPTQGVVLRSLPPIERQELRAALRVVGQSWHLARDLLGAVERGA